MLEAILAWVAVVLLLATSTGLLINRDWRWDIGFLSIQYLGAAILVAQHWPLGMAAAKLVTGWMATAALGMTLNALPPHEEAAEGFWPRGRAFRFFMVGMIVILAISAAPRVESSRLCSAGLQFDRSNTSAPKTARIFVSLTEL